MNAEGTEVKASRSKSKQSKQVTDSKHHKQEECTHVNNIQTTHANPMVQSLLVAREWPDLKPKVSLYEFRIDNLKLFSRPKKKRLWLWSRFVEAQAKQTERNIKEG